MDIHYTYVLLSEVDNKFYIGYTTNLELRFEDHRKGRVSATKERRPLQMVYHEGCLSKQDALRRERYFKTHYGRMFLKKRLKSYFTG